MAGQNQTTCWCRLDHIGHFPMLNLQGTAVVFPGNPQQRAENQPSALPIQDNEADRVTPLPDIVPAYAVGEEENPKKWKSGTWCYVCDNGHPIRLGDQEGAPLLQVQVPPGVRVDDVWLVCEMWDEGHNNYNGTTDISLCDVIEPGKDPIRLPMRSYPNGVFGKNWKTSHLTISWLSTQGSEANPTKHYCEKKVVLGDIKEDGKIYLTKEQESSAKTIPKLPLWAWMLLPIWGPAHLIGENRLARKFIPDEMWRFAVAMTLFIAPIELAVLRHVLPLVFPRPDKSALISPCPDHAPLSPPEPEAPKPIAPDPITKGAIDRLTAYCTQHSTGKWAMRQCLNASLTQSGIRPDTQGKCPAGTSDIPPFDPQQQQGKCFISQPLAQQAVCAKHPPTPVPPNTIRFSPSNDACPAR